MALLIGGWHLTTLILDRGISFNTSQCFSVFFNMLLFLIRIGKNIRCTSEISNKKASVCTEVSVPSMTKGKRTPSIQQQMQTIIAEDGLCNHPKGSYVCPFTLILLRTNTEPKKSVFVRSHCSGSVKSIVECWSVFKNLRFCAFTLIQSDFKNLRFCGYPLSIAFSKTSIFVAFLCRSM